MHYLVSGLTDDGIGKKLADILGLKVIKLYSKTFADGETLIRFIDFPDDADHVIVVQNLRSPQEFNLFNLLNISQGLKRRGVPRITAVTPYFCYARADREAISGDVVSMRTVLNLIESSGITSLFTIDLHNPAAIGDIGFNLINILPSKSIADYFRNNFEIDETWEVIAPDQGAHYRAMELGNILGIGSQHLIKTRDRDSGGVKYEAQELRVKENIILIDDITTTGSSIIKSHDLLRKYGAQKVHVVISHLVNEEAGEKIVSVINGEMLATMTFPSTFSKIGIAEILAEEIVKFF